jgi:phospholipid/cholesterol/gamma-HCH transport system permease protein
VLDEAAQVIVRALGTTGEFSLFGLRAVRDLFRPPYEFRETTRQVFDLGLRSAPLIAVSGVAVGIVLSMHTRASL